MKLTDLYPTAGKLSLSDLKLTLPNEYRLNERTRAVLSAYDMLLSDKPSFDNYMGIKEGLNTNDGRQQFITRQDIRREEVIQSFTNDVYKDLLDPNLSDEQKRELLFNVQSAPKMFNFNMADVIAQESTSLELDPTETDSEVMSRVDFLDYIKEVNEQKKSAAAAINGIALSRDPNWQSMLVDLGELLIPFGESAAIGRMLKAVGEEPESAFLGERKQQLYDILQNATPSQKAQLTEAIIQAISNNDKIVLTDGNDLVALEALNQILVNNDYSNFNRWFDNAVTVLDAVGVGVAIRSLRTGRAARAVKTLRDVRTQQAAEAIPEEIVTHMENEVAEGLADSTRTEVNPASPSQTIKEAAPDQSRLMHDMVVEDKSDEAARALYGANRDEALAKDILPEPDVRQGTPFKVNMGRPEFEEDVTVRLHRTQDGRVYMTNSEIERTSQRLAGRLENIEGFRLQPQSMKIGQNADGSTSFNMVYHPRNFGWKTADVAIENTLYALRQFGITEKDLQLLRRIGDEWVPTTPKELQALKEIRSEFTRQKKRIPQEFKEIDWAVAANYNHKFSAADDIIDTMFDVKWNFFDRFSSPFLSKLRQGSFTQHIMPVASVLDPHITGSAATAIDKAVRLRKTFVEMFEPFLTSFKKLNKDRQYKMTEYIQEANLKGIRFNQSQLLAKGFTPDEVKALRDWRKANDQLYWAANADMIQTLRNRGYQVLTNGSTLKLFVKPINHKAVKANSRIFSPIEDKVVQMTRKEIDEFVEKGGSFARLNEPTKIDDDWIEIVAVANTKEGGYLRALNDNDTVLHYREGYYPVMYDANWFVRMEVGDGQGGTFVKTIGSARTQDEAKALKERLIQEEIAKADGDEDVNIPRVLIEPDRRTNAEKYNGLSEDGFSIAMSSGLSAQKVRGQRLIDAGVDFHNSGHTNLVDPLEAVAMQISQLSNRTQTRNWFEATKQRWINNYFDKLDMKPNKFGEKYFPTRLEDIPNNPDLSSKIIGDARTLFNYINTLENGYINTIDEGLRSVVNSFADFLGRLGWKPAEVWGKEMAKKSLTSGIKGTTFKAFLASNPLRQVLVQGHQTVQLTAIVPDYVLGGGLAKDYYRISKAAYGATNDTEAIEMLEQLRRSGMLEAVDANNLIRSDMLRLADRTWAQKLGTTLSAPLRFTQRIGFDIGEQSVLVTSWLAHRHKAVKAGKKLTPTELERIAGRARAFTYNMNRAGDMPYNTNTLNVFAQFLQVPHKAILQPLTDRNLTKLDRAKLLTFNTIMYGIPTGMFAQLFSGMEDGPTKDVLQHGMEDVLLNGVATVLTGEKQNVDWGDFAPTDLHGTGSFLVNLLTLDTGRLLDEMPAKNLLFGGNSRLGQAFKTAVRYVYAPNDYEDPRLNTSLTDVAIAAGSMFSGFSNFFKARYAAETGRKISSLGNVADADVTRFEAAMQTFGFRTREETAQFEINQMLYDQEAYQGLESDVRLWYNDLKRHLARRGTTMQDDDIAWRVHAEAWRVFEYYDFKARASLRRMIENDLKKGDYDFIRDIINKIGVSTNEDVRKMISLIPDNAMRDRVMRDLDNYIEFVERAKSEGGD